MITTSTFYHLTYTQQADKILREGTFIQTRSENNFVVDLFELDELLVEVFYQRESEELVSIMAYNTTDNLRTLSKGINLSPRLTFKTERTIYPVKEYCA